MIQCCVCEDWFHSRVSHVSIDPGIYLVSIYLQHLGGVGRPPEGYEEMVCDSCMAKHSFLEAYRLAPAEKVVKSEVSEDVRVDVGDTSVGGSCDQSHDQSCELARRRRVAGKQGEGAGYFASSWRSTLCRCSNCMVCTQVSFTDTHNSLYSPSTRRAAVSISWMSQTPSPATRPKLAHSRHPTSQP